MVHNNVSSQAIERNALLENEMEDKAGLQVMVQRLKDESRGLFQVSLFQVLLAIFERPNLKDNADTGRNARESYRYTGLTLRLIECARAARRA